MWYFADMRSVLTDLLRAKYGAAARKCVEADGRFAQATSLISELANPQVTDVFAESQARGVSVTTY